MGTEATWQPLQFDIELTPYSCSMWDSTNPCCVSPSDQGGTRPRATLEVSFTYLLLVVILSTVGWSHWLSGLNRGFIHSLNRGRKLQAAPWNSYFPLISVDRCEWRRSLNLVLFLAQKRREMPIICTFLSNFLLLQIAFMHNWFRSWTFCLPVFMIDGL